MEDARPMGDEGADGTRGEARARGGGEAARGGGAVRVKFVRGIVGRGGGVGDVAWVWIPVDEWMDGWMTSWTSRGRWPRARGTGLGSRAA